jgi:hypothetical protein
MIERILLRSGDEAGVGEGKGEFRWKSSTYLPRRASMVLWRWGAVTQLYDVMRVHQCTLSDDVDTDTGLWSNPNLDLSKLRALLFE